MIADALLLLRDELQYYIESLGDGAGVILENVSLLEGGNDPSLKDKIIISMVNLEEESSLKNGQVHRRSISGGIDYVDPPIHLNLYLLFCPNFTGGDPPTNNYYRALKRLSFIIQFFQRKRVFTLANSPNSSAAKNLVTTANSDLMELAIKLELYTLTFEQINHLWGSLGGKQVPFVMYKARLVKIEDSTRKEAAVIEEIQGNQTAVN